MAGVDDSTIHRDGDVPVEEGVGFYDEQAMVARAKVADVAIRLEDDVLIEKGVGLDDERDIVRRVEAIVGVIAAKCRAAVAEQSTVPARKRAKLPPLANLIQRVQKIDAHVESKRMWDRSMKVLQQAYDMLLATGIDDGNDMVIGHFIRENYRVDSDLLVVCCHLLKKLHEGDVSDDMCFLTMQVHSAIITIIHHSFLVKKAAFEKREGGPLDLNPELLLLKYLRGFMLDEDNDILHQMYDALHYQEAATECICDYSKDGFSDYLEKLASRGRYHRLTDERAKYPDKKLYGEAGDAIIDAKIKTACFIDYDEFGLPFSNDATPQYPWADFWAHRTRFVKSYSIVRERFPDEVDDRRLVVADQLQVLRRASVAELLRKLVNKDLDFGESQSAQSTAVGIFTGETDTNYSSLVTRELSEDFEKSRVTLSELFRPIREILEREMEAFWEQRLKGLCHKNFKIVPSRVKSLESTLLKMLKDGTTKVGSITDLIGFLVLTDTEDEARELSDKVRALMVPRDIKDPDTWDHPTRRGYKSLDITGVPNGFGIKIQVQCRTKKLEALNAGRLSNHDAYKVITGNDLLNKINENPDFYLDLLYQAIHNMRVAYHVLRREPVFRREIRVVDSHLEQMPLPELDQTIDGSPASILGLYNRDYNDSLSIVRTSTLYEPDSVQAPKRST
jgi:hypothetical protein